MDAKERGKKNINLIVYTVFFNIKKVNLPCTHSPQTAGQWLHWARLKTPWGALPGRVSKRLVHGSQWVGSRQGHHGPTCQQITVITSPFFINGITVQKQVYIISFFFPGQALCFEHCAKDSNREQRGRRQKAVQPDWHVVHAVRQTN